MMNDMTTPGLNGGGLPPTAALTRYTPAARAYITAARERMEEVRYGFRVGDVGLLIGAGVVCEVIAPPPVSSIPHTPSWLSGVTNLRGSLVPVFNLKLLFEMEPGDRRDEMVLIMDKGEHAVGIVIDGYPHALQGLRPLAELPPLPEILRGHTRLGYLLSGLVWLEFEHRSFFHSLAQKVTS